MCNLQLSPWKAKISTSAWPPHSAELLAGSPGPLGNCWEVQGGLFLINETLDLLSSREGKCKPVPGIQSKFYPLCLGLILSNTVFTETRKDEDVASFSSFSNHHRWLLNAVQERFSTCALVPNDEGK